MNLFENIKKHKYLFGIILTLLLCKSFVQLFEFPNSIKLSLIRILLFITVIIIALYYLKDWKLRLIVVISIIGISVLQGELNVWKIPARKEVKMIEDNYSELFSYLKNQPTDFSLVSKTILYPQTINQENKELISKLFNNSAILEIEKNNSEILFVYDRFIDNGYGLLYTPKPEFEEEFWKEPFRINGLDITSISKISENWYYVSFT
ncbi:hypothetical protein [Moheibacter sediminis]|uniref:Uncharacterized protein n=1 Tax=Moheibacter sediminis TaxID=1434700 RepID=A0A1W2AXC1_9FLAO|nr:hypothetical protein [Moheibacter sediminis]SMC65190.1 hypothetical protein SAMN06296427_105111 [Moheibacter sediminis]